MSRPGPRQMDGYIRVSRRMGREGPGYISKDVQRAAVQRWADYRGITIIAWHEDEDESGETQQRPGMVEAMRRVRDGETDGIACWRLNRFARNVSEALDDVKAVHAAGGHLAFVEEDIDPTGPFGEFILTILLAVAALELNNIKASWRTAKERAMKRGAKIGPTPFGYQRETDGTLTIDETTGPLVTRAFEIAAENDAHAAMDFLAERSRGRAWTAFTVRRLLGTRTYLGEFRYGDLHHDFPDLALTDERTWQAAQETAPTRRRAAHFPLSGIAVCSGCGGPMVGGRGGRDRRTGRGLRNYRCAASMTRATAAGQGCPAPATMLAHILERYVREALATSQEDREVRDAGEAGETLAIAEREINDAEADREAFLANRSLPRLLGDERYNTELAGHNDTVAAARAFYKQVLDEMASTKFTADIPTLIREADDEELGPLLRGAGVRIVVDRGRGPVGSRVRVSLPGDDEPSTGVPPAHHP